MKSYTLIPDTILHFISSNDKSNFNKTLNMLKIIIKSDEFENRDLFNLATSFNNIQKHSTHENIVVALFRKLTEVSSKENFDEYYYYLKKLLEFDVENKKIITRNIRWDENSVLSIIFNISNFHIDSFNTKEDFREFLNKYKKLIFFIFDNFVNRNYLESICSTILTYYEDYFEKSINQELVYELKDELFTYMVGRIMLAKSFYIIPYNFLYFKKNSIEKSIKYSISKFPCIKKDIYFIQFISKFISRLVSIECFSFEEKEILETFIERTECKINNKINSLGLSEYSNDKTFMLSLFCDFINNAYQKIYLRDIIMFNYLSKVTNNFSNDIGKYIKESEPYALYACKDKYFYRKLVEAGWKENKKSKQLFDKLDEPIFVSTSTKNNVHTISLKDIPLDVDEDKNKKLIESLIYETKCLDNIKNGIKILRETIEANNINLLKILMKFHINPFLKDELGSAIDYCKKVGNKDAEDILKSYYFINSK